MDLPSSNIKPPSSYRKPDMNMPRVDLSHTQRDETKTAKFRYTRASCPNGIVVYPGPAGVFECTSPLKTYVYKSKYNSEPAMVNETKAPESCMKKDINLQNKGSEDPLSKTFHDKMSLSDKGPIKKSKNTDKKKRGTFRVILQRHARPFGEDILCYHLIRHVEEYNAEQLGQENQDAQLHTKSPERFKWPEPEIYKQLKQLHGIYDSDSD